MKNNYRFSTQMDKKSDNISTGAATVKEEEEEGFYFNMNKRCSVFTAETAAVVKALEKWCCDKSRGDIIIFNDLKSVLMTSMNNDFSVYKNKYVMETKKKIYDNKGKVILVWILAHKEIKSNEKADELAKTRTEEECTRKLKVSYTDLKENYKEEARRRMMERNLLESEWKGRKYFTKQNISTEGSRNHGLVEKMTYEDSVRQ